MGVGVGEVVAPGVVVEAAVGCTPVGVPVDGEPVPTDVAVDPVVVDVEPEVGFDAVTGGTLAGDAVVGGVVGGTRSLAMLPVLAGEE